VEVAASVKVSLLVWKNKQEFATGKPFLLTLGVTQ
jgi:hypothetical protein